MPRSCASVDRSICYEYEMYVMHTHQMPPLSFIQHSGTSKCTVLGSGSGRS